MRRLLIFGDIIGVELPSLFWLYNSTCLKVNYPGSWFNDMWDIGLMGWA